MVGVPQGSILGPPLYSSAKTQVSGEPRRGIAGPRPAGRAEMPARASRSFGTYITSLE